MDLETAPAIRTRGLTRLFRGGQGVRELDLDVPAGAIYGFLGPNGAGKTTGIRLLLGLLRADAGRIELFGEPLDGRRLALRQVGALVESPSLYRHLSGRDNLEVTRRLLGAPRARIDAVLARVDLAADADRRVREYSLGMRQRLAIALALLGEPRLLVLDEPSNGLDPAGIVELRQLLRGLAVEGTTVFVSSHLLSEVELVATHVGVLQAGRLRFQGRLEELRGRVRPRLRLRVEPALRAAELLTRLGESVHLEADGALRIDLRQREPAELNRLLVEHGIAVSALQVEQASLESMFFDLTIDSALGEGGMNALVRALSAEALKLKGTLALWMCLVAPAVVVVLYVLQITFSHFPASAAVRDPAQSWQMYCQSVFALWAFLMLPLFVTLEAALLAGLEHGDRQWKHLLALPLPRGAHLAAKLLALAALVALAFLALLVLAPLGGWLLPWLQPAFGIAGPPPWDWLLRTATDAYLASLLVVALQCWIAVRWQSFTVAVSVGMGATVMGFLIGQSERFGHWYPWSMPLQVLAGKGQWASFVVAAGTIGFFAVALLALADFRRREFD